MMIFDFDSVANVVGKGENDVNKHFLLFTQCFQKASFSGSLKVGDCVVKSYVSARSINTCQPAQSVQADPD